jgi:hypothetical protein
MTTSPLWVPGADALPGGSDNTYRWATVTQADPLRIRLDGDTAALPITPETLVDPYLLVVGQRVWLQMFGRRIIILGTPKANSDLAGTIRRVGSTMRLTSTANSTVVFNICTVTIPNPVNGRTYQAKGIADITPDTAGAYTVMGLKWGVGAVTTGTNIMEKYIDHRIANRIVEGVVFGDFVYTGTTGAANVNVVFVATPMAGSGCLCAVPTNHHAILTVDEIL